MKQRHAGLLCADQEARLKQQGVEGHGLHGHGLAAHVGAGDDGSPLLQTDGDGHEAAALLRQQVADLGVDHVGELQLRLRQLGADAAVAHGEQSLLDDEVQPAGGLRVRQQVVHHGGQRRAHGPADVHFLGVLLGAQTGALQAQVVLLRIGLGVEQTLLHVLLGLPHLFELGGGAVGDVEAAAAGAVGVQDGQRRLGVVEDDALKMSNGVDLRQQRPQAVQTLEVALDLEQLHVVRRLPLRAAAQGCADVLHLAQTGHQFGVLVLQPVRRRRGPLYII